MTGPYGEYWTLTLLCPQPPYPAQGGMRPIGVSTARRYPVVCSAGTRRPLEMQPAHSTQPVARSAPCPQVTHRPLPDIPISQPFEHCSPYTRRQLHPQSPMQPIAQSRCAEHTSTWYYPLFPASAGLVLLPPQSSGVFFNPATISGSDFPILCSPNLLM